MKLVSKKPATIYEFETIEAETPVYFRIECMEGIVSGIQKYSVEYYDCGDKENGPRVGSELSAPMEMVTSQVWFENKLEEQIDEIVKDAEAYTAYCMQAAADYSGMVR